MSVTELAVGKNERQPINFFSWITIAMAAIIFGGFGISYLIPMATGSLDPLPPIVHIHGLFYFAWMILLVVQPALIRQGNVALHRSLGLLGISIGTGVVLLGSIVTIIFTKNMIAISEPNLYGLMYISLLAVLGFGSLFFLALKNIRNSTAHKRFVLFATITLLIGGLNRIYAAFGFDVDAEFAYLLRYLTVDLFIVAIIMYDWKSLGQLHRATIIGASVNIVPQILHAPIVGSAMFVTMTHWLGSLAT